MQRPMSNIQCCLPFICYEHALKQDCYELFSEAMAFSGQLLITAIYTSAEADNIDLRMSRYLDFDHTLVIFVRQEKVYLIYH